MRTLSFVVCVLAVLAWGAVDSAAQADGKGKRRSSKPAKDTGAGESALAITTCEYKGPTSKNCLVQGRLAEFEVKLSGSNPAFVVLDENVKMVTPPDDRYVDYSRSGQFLAYTLVGSKIPQDVVSVIKTDAFTVTLHFTAISDGGDSQVHILRADRAQEDELVRRRVDAARQILQKKYDRRFAQLDAKAVRLARLRTLVQIQKAGVRSFDPGVRPTRHDFVVLRAERGIAIGDERYLTISVENRDRPTLHMGRVHAWLERKGYRRTVGVMVRCGQTALRGRDKTTCTLGLDLDGTLEKGERLRVRVTSKDKKRTVTLSGIDLR